MIQDDELRDLFQVESDEHLQALDDGLLRLETAPGDTKTLEAVFRAAHSLKGAARMLGVSKVELIAHHMEDELGQVRRGHLTLDSTGIDRYSEGLAAMRDFVLEATAGTKADRDIDAVLARLKPTSPASAAPPTQSPDAFNKAPGSISQSLGEISQPSGSISQPLGNFAEPLGQLSQSPGKSAEQLGQLSQASGNLAQLPGGALAVPEQSQIELVKAGAEADGGEAGTLARGEFRIQTMRVPPAKLDALLTLASELTVTGTRVLRGFAVFEEIGALHEEWQKDTAAHRALWAPDKNRRAQNGAQRLGATRLGTARAQNAEISPDFLAPNGAIKGAARGFSPADWKAQCAFQARAETRLARLGGLLETLQTQAMQDVTRLNFVADELEEGIRGVRLLPLSQVFGLFPRLVRDLARELGKEVEFSILGGEIAADKRILESIKDPLMHMVRNALDHGIAAPGERERMGKPRVARLQLRAAQHANFITIELQDDGRGLDLGAIKATALARGLHSAAELDAMSPLQLHSLIFAPGFSTAPLVTDLSGRGVGMDVVRTNIERLKGSIQVASQPGVGTTFSVRLPSTLATTRVLLVGALGQTFALPIEWIVTILDVERDQIWQLESRAHFLFEDRAVPIAPLATLLELPPISAQSPRDLTITVVLEVGAARFAVQVEALLDEQEVMLKPLGALLKRVRNVSGVTILGAGEICLVLSAPDLAKSSLKSAPVSSPNPDAESAPARKVLLLVEDSITTRTQEKRILEGAGYEVVVAVDGADGWRKLETRAFDGVVSDIEMPHMDGLTLAARIREVRKYDEMPIILLTSLSSDADRQRGVEVGANAYLTKGTFEQKVLLDTLRRLV